MHQPPVRFTYRLLSYLISTIIAGQPLLPAVGAVITPQNGAGMDKAANGVPVVNIATPNGAGISHNRFTDYNVGKEGLILNNATGKLNPTQLGGLIQNNPNLKAGGEAKGIINEVTGGNRSLLQGYTEVAGKAANVMVANPYGITCDGCGFINTPHATLTTGRPVMNADGSLQALEVTEGSITINGAGLDGTRSDAVSIIARATEVNAALHAKDLTVTAGANRVTADGRVSALKGEGDVPKVAVDTGALGGMYARRIHLTSTESGVGVNLGNLYARDGDITLDASGRLTVNNSLATGAVTAKGQGVTLTGDHKAGGNLSVSSRSDIVLSNGTLNSDKNLSLTAGGRITQQNEKLTAGRDVTLAAKNITQDTASQINAARDIVTVASDTLTTQGQITAGQNLTASATTLTQDGILLAKGHAGLDAGTLNNSGAVQGASLTLGSTTLSNSGSLLSGGRLTVNTRDFTQSGRTGAKGKVDITASGNPGKITADTLNVRATTLDGDGLLQGAGALALAGDTLSQGSHGRWLTAGDLSLRGKTLNTAGTTQGQNLTVQADNWANSGSVLATGNLTASATGQLTSTGDIMSQGDTTLKAATTDNRGSLLSAGTLSLDGNSLDNSGTVQGDHVTIRQNSVTNSGTLTGIAALTLAARMVSPQPALMNNGGSLLTSGDLTITAGSITSSGHWQGKRVLITADSLANSGAIQAADSLTARLTGELVSTAGSKVTSNGEMALSALNLSNSGQWIAKNLTLKANSLTSAGDITGVDALTLTVNQTLNNQASGKLLSAGVLTLKADSVTNDGQLQGNATTITAGQLTNGGHLQGETLTLAASGGVNNRSGGVLMSRNALNVSTATLSNQGTIQGGGGVSLNATDRLQNDGKILSGGNLTLTAQVLANTGSGLVQAVTLLLDVVNAVNDGRVLATGSTDVKGTSLNNSGTLQGVDLLVNYHTFSNSGTLLGTSGLGVKGSSLLQNGTGRLYSAGNLLLDAQDFSGQGQVVATGDVTLKLIAALTNYGTLAAGKTLSVTSQNAITNGGVMQGDAMVLGAGEAFTNNGTLTAGKGNSVFSAQRLFLNAPGSLQAGGDVSLNSRSDITISGFTGTAGSLTMNVAGTLLNSALIYAGNNLKLFTDRLHNQHGDILAGNSLWVQKDSSGTANSEIINRSGNIETTRGDITMNTAHLLNSWDAISASHEVIPGSSHGVISPVPENNRWWGVVRHDGVEYLAVYWGKGATVPDEYRIRTGDTDTVTVSASGHAARISGGADMHIRAGRLDNEASFILAGGGMTLSGDTLNNQGWQEGTTGKETVWRLASGSLPKAWFTEPWYKVYRQVSPDATEASGTSPAGQYRAVISAAGDVSASFATDTGNTTVMPRAGGAGNTITVPSLNSLTPPTVSQGVSGEALLNESGTGITGPVWNDALPDTLKDIPGALSLSGASVSSYPLPSGNNGYFVPSTDPDSPYLITVNPKLDGLGKVDSSLFAGLYDLLRMQPGQAPRETDPAYTDEKQFLGSSYILDRLGLKPEKDYRFLGDAAFDTRYVSNVILNQTGSRYINGTGSDLAQMKYLMDSAAAQQKALGLTFGVSLTAGQVAQLTRSLLWWESVTINGQTVMVPKLYLSPEDITLHNGSVISGNNVQLAGGNITNSGGSINAQNDLLLDSTGSIDNLNAGLINAGGALNLKAIGDIGNISSVISGKTVSLESATGNISNLTRTEQWAMNNG